QIHPLGFIDGIDTPGTTGGVASGTDTLEMITVKANQHSRENNFSEVQIARIPIITENPQPEAPIPAFAAPAPQVIPELVIPTFIPPFRPPYLDGSDGAGYTWHLSIIDAGYPRGIQSEALAMHLISAPFDVISWYNARVANGEWILQDADGNQTRRKVIGLKDAIPVAGDFNGDTVVDLGLYVDGHWFIDLDGDGKWDESDLWAK